MNAKSSIFSPAVIFVCVLGVVGLLLLVWLQFNVKIESIGSDAGLLPQTAQPQVTTSGDPVLSSSSVLEEDTSSNTSSAPTSTTQPPSLDKQNIAQSEQSDGVAAIAGSLRVSNQSDRPLRVALLVSAPKSATSKPKYGEPVHWDFAPGEGGSQGLIVSLPEGNLKLKKGDILVAFAQDGSRRYWGPFVVGETDTPVLNPKTSEWQLILQP